MRVILQNGDVIKVREEVEISINGDNIPVPYNILVLEAAEHIIFNSYFGHNGL